MVDNEPWRLTGFYGYPERNRRKESWGMLYSLSQSSPLSWCCIRDYNDLLSQNEKVGKCGHPGWLLSGFWEATMASGLIDLGMHGYFFTWEKSRGTSDWIQERLDRAMASSSWISHFPNSVVHSLKASGSNHLSIFLDNRTVRRRRRVARFRFENAWLHDGECEGIVQASWVGSMGHLISFRIRDCGMALGNWVKSPTRLFKSRVSAAKDKMAHLIR